MRIALTGNPNSGKTTMFNALTGSSEQVGNWAGVTVDKKEHPIKKGYCFGDNQIIAVDLPGAYSMSPFTSEESITHTYINNENPDAIINIVDATNLSRSLFFTTQLLELGIPLVVALNKADINEKKETLIDTALLSQKLGCPVIDTVSVTGEGMAEVVKAAVTQIGKQQNPPYIQGEVDLTNKDAVVEADRKRFAFVNKIVKEVESRKVLTRDKNFTDKIDAVLTNKWLGIPVFAVVMFLVFQLSQVWVGPAVADGFTIGNFAVPGLVTLIEWLQGFVGGYINNNLLYALVVDGIIGGVGAVIGFLPLVMVMYFLIALLEDCGYMSRVSVVLDPIFKRVGLSGKSVIPFVIGIGCAVPGVMASRTIRNERERRATAMLAPFIALIAGVFFEEAGWVSTIMYLSGIVIIFFGALLVNRITGNRNKRSYFIIELPEYKFPSLWGAFKSMCSRGWAYIVKAATIILLCNTAVQVMQSFTWNFASANETASNSILATVAQPFAYILLPVVGIVSWQLAAASIAGFIAKENVVGTLAVCFSLGVIDKSDAETMGITSVAALAFLMFNLFTPPCFAAIGAMNAEMKSTKWMVAGLGLQFGVGFTVSYLVYTVGTIIVDAQKLNIYVMLGGLAAVLAMVGIVVALIIKNDKRIKAENELKKAKKAAGNNG